MDMFSLNASAFFSITNMHNTIPTSSLNSSQTKQSLQSMGINTNSAQYRAATANMGKFGGLGHTTASAIRNRMSHYDANGDFIDPISGLTGMLVTDKNRNSIRRMVNIPENIKQEMFDLTKREFLAENGVQNGDTTKRSDVFYKMYPQIKKDDRLAAGYTLEQYESEYTQAFYDAVKAKDPNWSVGKPINPKFLEGITRQNVEATLQKNSSGLIKVGIHKYV
ncbi:DUF3879 family protein [Criibacterium bergeronii]|nr:DUF3879 family protein [Criibacterium bergeronii]